MDSERLNPSRRSVTPPHWQPCLHHQPPTPCRRLGHAQPPGHSPEDVCCLAWFGSQVCPTAGAPSVGRPATGRITQKPSQKWAKDAGRGDLARRRQCSLHKRQGGGRRQDPVPRQPSAGGVALGHGGGRQAHRGVAPPAVRRQRREGGAWGGGRWRREGPGPAAARNQSTAAWTESMPDCQAGVGMPGPKPTAACTRDGRKCGGAHPEAR